MKRGYIGVVVSAICSPTSAVFSPEIPCLSAGMCPRNVSRKKEKNVCSRAERMRLDIR